MAAALRAEIDLRPVGCNEHLLPVYISAGQMVGIQLVDGYRYIGLMSLDHGQNNPGRCHRRGRMPIKVMMLTFTLRPKRRSSYRYEVKQEQQKHKDDIIGTTIINIFQMSHRSSTDLPTAAIHHLL